MENKIQEGSLYIRYRPIDFIDMFGNEQVIASVEDIIRRDSKNRSRAFLFSGPSGTGKTTLARILAKKLGANNLDLIEVDSAEYRGIDTIRLMRQKMRLSPLHSSCKVWILDECHQLSKDAQTALLKALEDTPSHVYFILCTTDPKKLLPTIVNRCTTFKLSSLDNQDIMDLLRQVSKKEKKFVARDVFESITDISKGSPRLALVNLDKIIDLPEPDMKGAIQDILADDIEIVKLCRALMKGVGWNTIADILKGLSSVDPETIRRVVMGYFSVVLLKSDNPKAYLILDSFRSLFYNNGKADLIMACYEVTSGA